MSQVSITNRLLDSLSPSVKPYFIRDSFLKGFGVKVNPSGSIKFIAEVKHQGKAKRKTVGESPLVSLNDARRDVLIWLSEVKSGLIPSTQKDKSFKSLFIDYLSNDRLKQRTVRDYKETINFYLQDWLNKPVS